MPDNEATAAEALSDEPLLAPCDVARRLNIPVGTLHRWRSVGTGPKAYKIGRHLRYRRADVEGWLADQVAESRLGTGSIAS